MAAVEQLTAQDLLFPVRDSFHSKVHIDSLVKVLEENQLLKKKEKKKLLQCADENAKKSLVFNKLYRSDLSVERVIELFTESENVHLSRALQSILSSAQKSATNAATSIATAIPVVEDVSGSETEQVSTTPSLPPFKYYYPLDNNPSAIFSSTGGVLYSPVYGVMVYIPAGAILGEEQVEVSFQVVTDEVETQKFLSRSLLEGSVLCSSVFEFEAKLVDAPDGVEFAEFHSDVWIELPHCLSFGGCSLKEYSTAFVVSDSKGRVEVETQALFSEGYPYVNLPVRHFSRFCVADSPKKRFRTNREETTVSRLREYMQKLRLSNSVEDDQSAPPHTHSKQLKQRVTESATYSTAAEKRACYEESKKTSSEASAEEQRQALIHQDACDNLCDDDDAMEIDQRAPVDTAFNASLQQQALNVPSLSLMACVCQPAGRHKLDRWTAEIVFVPLLPKALKDLAKYQEQIKHEIDGVAFRLDASAQLMKLDSEPSNQEWMVKLSTMEILLEHLTAVTPSSKMITLLPKSVATVQNKGAALPLYHLITVEGSWPTAHCYLTCEVGPRSVESTGVKPNTVQAGDGCILETNGPTEHQQHGHTASSDPPQVAPQETLPPTLITVQWERDRYILTLLSIMVPEDQLDTLRKSLSLSRITIDQIMSGYRAGSAPNVGERAYKMFKRASSNEQPLTFAKILVGLNEIGRSDDLVPILRSYIQSRLSVQSLSSRASSGTPSEAESGHGPSTLFITWLHANHPTLVPRTCPSGVAVERAILPKEQSTLFTGLSRRMVCVWRMVGRLLGLPDWEIDAIDNEGRRSHDGGRESCYQMLLRWVKHSRSPAYITYCRLLAALELTSLGRGAALDATSYLNHFILDLAS